MPDYPPEPWDLAGHGYVSLWRVPAWSLPALPDDVRPVTMFGRAVVATAFVDYLPDGVLAYRELLAAVLVRRGRRLGVSITHIWVDSEPSRSGARAMWSIPKEIAEFRFTDGPVLDGSVLDGSVSDGSVFDGSAATPEGRIAHATFASRPVTVRLPFPLRGTTFQALDGRRAETPITARGPVRLARATWTVDPEGPLAWLRGAPLVSVATRGFRMRFGPRRWAA